jgi:type I restriction enzyme S subunit
MSINQNKLPLLGQLPNIWQVVEFQSVLNEGTRNGIYKKKEFHGSGDKIVNMGELFAFPRLFSVAMKRVELSKIEQPKFRLEVGDLLFARRSLVAEGAGKCCIVCELNESTVFESSIIRARPNKKIADSFYLYYLFCSPYGRYILETIRRQVAVSGITGADLSQLPIPLPPLPEQKAIAHILGTLDDKIELNQKMNQTLEAMARAIFKSWFVDFDPVRAKMEGKQPVGMDTATADLFPDSFEESALGLIPKGWRVGTVGDITENLRRSVKPDNITPDTPYIGLEHMPRRNITLSEWGAADDINSNKYEFYQGEILFGKLRPYFHKVGVAPLNGICSTDILVINSKSSGWFSFDLSTISTDDFINYTDIISTGTRMPRTNWKDMSMYEIVIPPFKIAQALNQNVLRFVNKIHSNVFESRTLANIRDTLLPKLMSGEIRVKEAETMVEEVA